MKQIITTFTASLFMLTVFAQDLPKPSPAAKVEQRVGLTDVSVTYSRPGVKDRTIWGDLVPYGEMWRAGANKATLFSTSADIEIDGNPLPKGDYSLFILPNETGDWSMVWNKETELWGTGDYKAEEDAVRVNVQAEDIEGMTERLEYRFIDVDVKSTKLAMDWAGKRVHVSIDADPKEQALANISSAIDEAEEDKLWRVYRTAAAYAEDNNMTAEGMEWIEKSVELKDDSWYTYWVYGSLLAQNKEGKKAIKMGEKAIELGKADNEDFSYEERIRADMKEWSGM